MNVELRNEIIHLQMTHQQFVRLMDIINMVDVDFDKLDAAAGGDMSRDQMEEFMAAWQAMVRGVNWPLTETDRAPE